MRGMLLMLKRMAVRTKDFEIFERIILPIPVLVMNAKNRLAFIISAALALADHTSYVHVLSYGSECRKPNLFCRFVVAGHGAIFSVNRRRVTENLAAVCA